MTTPASGGNMTGTGSLCEWTADRQSDHRHVRDVTGGQYTVTHTSQPPLTSVSKKCFVTDCHKSLVTHIVTHVMCKKGRNVRNSLFTCISSSQLFSLCFLLFQMTSALATGRNDVEENFSSISLSVCVCAREGEHASWNSGENQFFHPKVNQ